MFPIAIPGFAVLGDVSADSAEGGLRSVANKFFSTINGAAAQIELNTAPHTTNNKKERILFRNTCLPLCLSSWTVPVLIFCPRRSPFPIRKQCLISCFRMHTGQTQLLRVKPIIYLRFYLLSRFQAKIPPQHKFSVSVHRSPSSPRGTPKP